MNDNINYFSEDFTHSSVNHRYYSTISNNIQLRRNSYQMAMLTSKQDRLELLYSTSASISSIIDHINTTRSLCTISDGCSYCVNDYIQRSTSQPIVHSSDNDVLLENATFLLDSPVHALHPTHHKSHGILSLKNPFSTSHSLITNECLNERNDCLNSSTISIISVYRIVFLRSFALVLILACLFTIEVLQTSIYSSEYSFQILLTLHLSSSIIAFIFSAYTSHIQLTRYRWKISDIFAYDRCSQILIIFTTICTSLWIIMQYFYSFYFLLLISTSITGISLSCLIIKTFDHLLQLSATLPIENNKLLTKRINIFICIYNSMCHLALTIGGICLLMVILFEQQKYKYILIGSQSCLLISCTQLTNQQDDNELFFKPLTQSKSINLTMYLTKNQQVWADEPTRYIFFVCLIILIIISLFIQVTTEWTTSIMSMSRRLSILYYSNKDLLNDTSKIIHYKHYLFALFIGFQEGYIFGNIIKFDVTCLYGLRHTAEMLIIYGLGATTSSILLALIIKRMTMMTCVSFTTLLHLITIILLFLIRIQNDLYNVQPLILKYILFFSYGIILGLWSTISIYSICNSMKFSSSSTFAQSLALRYVGRIIAYTCILFLCQSSFVYIDTFCLLFLFSFIFICYCCCNQ
ncbi:unnamed protein product [Rotaria sordida]|uniref:Uncharacterized protein n=1 Tax=Rotaria sordida TaxID=392033 RepID=A0A815FHJ1_9BILA|nr:unnamed protein product [Rotaria sordida]CAF4023507.1 unnamed protein product [Rotaria sordida]